jgi:excisionase family DNA binding protein
MGHKQPERDVGEPLMLTYREAARKIGVSLRWLYHLMREGEIRKLELGPQVMRIPMSECEAYVERKKAEQWDGKPEEAA